MTFTVTLGRQEPLNEDQKRARYRRALEVIDGAGWLFDDYISEQTKALLDTNPEDPEGPKKREEFYRRAIVAAGLKAELKHIIETKEAEDKAYARRHPND